MHFNTGDRTLDNILDECRAKFSDRNPLVRREALERLWDAWERLKSLADPSDKKRSVKIILDTVTSVPSLRERLETEATELNSIGNSRVVGGPLYLVRASTPWKGRRRMVRNPILRRTTTSLQEPLLLAGTVVAQNGCADSRERNGARRPKARLDETEPV
jgi:hypothetical protein